MTELPWGLGNNKEESGRPFCRLPGSPTPLTQLKGAQSTASRERNKGGPVRCTAEEAGVDKGTGPVSEPVGSLLIRQILRNHGGTFCGEGQGAASHKVWGLELSVMSQDDSWLVWNSSWVRKQAEERKLFGQSHMVGCAGVKGETQARGTPNTGLLPPSITNQGRREEGCSVGRMLGAQGTGLAVLWVGKVLDP